MTAVTHLQSQFVTSFPTPMEPGYVYTSIEYKSCGHLCACGCGHEVITPLSPAQWAFSYDGETISLNPSIGNWTLPCRSHYFVYRGRVRWARDYSDFEIERNRRRDRVLLDDRHPEGETHLGSSSEVAGPPVSGSADRPERNGWRQRVVIVLRRCRPRRRSRHR